MRNRIVAAGIVLLLSCWLCPVSQADSFQVTITTTPIKGQSGFMVLDFVAGFPVLNNTATVSVFASDATLGGYTTTGAVSGTLVPGPLVLSDTDFLNEWSQGMTFGSTMTFTLTLTTNFKSGDVPDEFSFFLEDSTGTPYPTSDPTGANALFVIDATGSPQGAVVFGSAYASATVTRSTKSTFSVLHTFKDQGDGTAPVAGVTIDHAGNLYGTTFSGGTGTNGTVFKLHNTANGWVLSPLYSFTGYNDGGYPAAPLTLGADGSLYGTTAGAYDGGTAFRLRPPPTRPPSVLSPWNLTVLHQFTGIDGDGSEPWSNVIFDPSGNLYGTTEYGGDYTYGTVYELTPSGSGWVETTLHSFQNDENGINPYAGVVFDKSGNLYGTTTTTSLWGAGTVFQLVPSGASWAFNLLHSFYNNEGSVVYAGLISDQLGNLYGATNYGGSGGGGTVFELTPSNGSWTFNILYGLPKNKGGDGPHSALIMDGAGNLYGTTEQDGVYNNGSVFELTPSNGGWVYTNLHSFTGGNGGKWPIGGVALDGNGNLYGTTEAGGYTSGSCAGDGCGVVWEITP